MFQFAMGLFLASIIATSCLPTTRVRRATKEKAGVVSPYLISLVGDKIPGPRCLDLPTAQFHRVHRVPVPIHTDRVTAA